MPKGEKVLAQSKRTAPPTISKMKSFKFVLRKDFSISIFYWYISFDIIGIPSSKLISKTLLNTKRRISLRGSFV
jgi:hypothetical protein